MPRCAPTAICCCRSRAACWSILIQSAGRLWRCRSKANTHQHGVALTRDGRHLLIVGTGPAGDAQGPPCLTVLDLATMVEESIPLSRPHEQVALSPDGRLAYVTGGHSFGNAGWDGVSVVDLQRRSVTELAVPDRPLDIQIFP